ncbi:sialidase family protein [Dictyobacter aurantiacus]|uniref:Glycosyl hydrolase n=1 Tax=Dictyobacter aurantiacus TaxID=1936993 RepID=A0A401ZSW9_9CHLR|nr:sialidase family protein [Dictyobacter aurantiacus]GCE09886.1 glycosyl hydrolase [Dictyobacter aurantiacus]
MAQRKRYPSGTVVLTVGTKRGLFLLSSSDRVHWEVESTALSGRIFYAVCDPRANYRLFAADNGDFFGSFIRYSDDFGQTWQEPRQGVQFTPDSGLNLKNIWYIEPGRAQEPGVVYAGTDPACLWISTNGGETWEPNTALLEHPTRERWEPGAGGLCLHSIVADYANPERMWIGISAVGCLRTDDGGKSWKFANKNTRADFQPDRYPEFGQCIHRLLQHPNEPDMLYQQNHCGLYKSLNAGDDWIDVHSNLTSDFGFPLALDPYHPETLYSIVEGEGRHNLSEQFTVYRTQNAGEEWEALTQGLPKGPNVRLGVLRHGMCTDALDPCGVYVGTNTGQLFASNDRGDHWQLIADYLPTIYSVSAIYLL